MSTVLGLAVGALCGGFVNGLAGFGTGLTTLGLWLHGAGCISRSTSRSSGIVLCTDAAQGMLTPQVGRYLLVCLPGTIVGAFLGVRVYGRVDDRQFRALVLWLPLASGIVLMVSNLG